MALHLLHFSLLLTTASGFVTPNAGHVTKCYDQSNHRDTFVSVSHNPCKNGVSLEMVNIESDIIATVFAATVGYIMYQDAVEITNKKKEKKARISGETQEVVKKIKAVKDEPELKKVIDEARAESNELEPEKFVEEVNVGSNEPEGSREPPTASNDIEESEVIVEPKEPKMAAAESFNRGSDILDIKKSVASTLQGEKEKVDRLDAVPEKNISNEEIIESSQETSQEEVPVIDKIVVEAPVYGRKRRFVKKSVKKMLMPWKKWSNL